MATIIPSIANANTLRLEQELGRIQDIPALHVDIEDGNFLPNITFGLKTVDLLCRQPGFAYDVHLLVTNPMDYVQPLCAMNIKAVAAHVEALEYPGVFLSGVRQRGRRAGLALNMKTGINQLRPFVELLDYVIIMTGEPDGMGAGFNSAMLDKLAEARELLPPHVSLWADGGVGESQLPEVLRRGADTVVMGRAIWESEDARQAYRHLEAVAISA